MLEDRLDLRPEYEAVRTRVIVEWFDPEPVARHEQRLLLLVPDGEREHAAQPRHDPLPPLFPTVQDHFGVGRRGEGVARREFSADVVVVVDLAVEDDDDRTVFIVDRLPATLEIDDREPLEGQAGAATGIVAVPIRSSMPNGGVHPA
jgi:hypothetical protein